MNQKFVQVVAVGAAFLSVGLLASCGNEGDSSRNRNSELGAVACIDAVNSSASQDGTALILGACAEATKWAKVNSDGSVGEKSDISNNSIQIPIIGTGPVTIQTFNSSDETVGIDVVKPNGSRNGIVYRVDTTGSKPVYYEAAPIGWSGNPSDPIISESQIAETISVFNNSSNPSADWVLGNEWEMQTILIDADLIGSLGISSDRTNWYWTGGRFRSFFPLLIERPETAGGYTAETSWFRRMNYLRPVRSFNSGTEGVVAVKATFSPAAPSTTSTIVEETTTTTLEVIPSTTLAPDQEQVVQIIDPNVTEPTLPNGPTEITITSDQVDTWKQSVSAEEISSIQIVIDKGEPVDISLTDQTLLQIPASAMKFDVQIALASGETVSVEKNIVRVTETSTDSTSTTTSVASTPDSTLAPASADNLDEPGVVVAGEESSSESSSNTGMLLIVFGAVVVVVIAGVVTQQRRKKK